MTASQSTAKPAKPRPDFPLFAANNGQWAKKFKGRKQYFGPWSDPDGAEKRWREFEAKHTLGIDPAADANAVVVGDLVDGFLRAKDAKVQTGDLSRRTWNDYKRVGDWLIKQLGAYRPVHKLGPEDFTDLRLAFPTSWGTTSITNQVMMVRTIFGWGMKSGLISTVVRYGDNFSKPPRRRVLLDRQERETKEFSAAEIWVLFHGCDSPQLRAMILLGLNCGYGNHDCARLRVRDIQGAYLKVPRSKTGEARKAWLWPETRDALREVLEAREGSKVAPKPGAENLVFRTHHGRAWVCEETNRNAISIEFAKLKKSCGLHRNGVSFYALRHMTETIGGEVKDQVAVNFVMGHVDDTMGATYRNDVSDKRVKAVCSHIRDWFMAAQPKRGAK